MILCLGCKIPAEGVQMHPPSLFAEALSRKASRAYSLNDKQGGKGVIVNTV